MSVIELKISEKISGGYLVENESIVIPDKIKATVVVYEASCPDSALATSRLTFGDDILWVIQREIPLPVKIDVVGNGVKTFKLICDNECAGHYYFNAYVKIGVNDGH